MKLVSRLAVSSLFAACTLVALASPAHAAPAPAHAFAAASSQCGYYLINGQIYVTCTTPTLVRAIYFNGTTKDFCVTGFTSLGSPNQLAGYGDIGTCVPARLA